MLRGHSTEATLIPVHRVRVGRECRPLSPHNGISAPVPINPNAWSTDKESMEVMMNEPTKQASWQDFLDTDAPLTEDAVWQAIADANDLDYSEIADGDILDYL